jgi:hypothetical protein
MTAGHAGDKTATCQILTYGAGDDSVLLAPRRLPIAAELAASSPADEEAARQIGARIELALADASRPTVTTPEM